MKVRTSVKAICEHCKVIRRRGVVRIICKKNRAISSGRASHHSGVDMARIAGVDLPREKRVEIGLTYIYGIGRATAQKILEQTGVCRSGECTS